MWQSSMLIFLIVLAHKQIYVPFLVKHDSMHSGPVAPLEPLVMLISHCHFYGLWTAGRLNAEGYNWLDSKWFVKELRVKIVFVSQRYFRFGTCLDKKFELLSTLSFLFHKISVSKRHNFQVSRPP